MPEFRRLLLPGLTALIVACSGGDQAGDPDGSLGTSGGLSAGSADSSNDAIGAPRTSGQTGDRAGDGIGEQVRPAPTDTGASVIEQPPGSPAPNPHPWVSGTSSGGTRGSGAAMLRSVRMARHDGYDRIVFEFDSHVPQWRVAYVDSPQHECGSGAPLRLEGHAWLQVDFDMANAHTPEGHATAAPRHVADPAGTNLREMRRICDFEAHVAYVIGVGAPNEYRAFQLSSPARLVVDVRQ